MTTWQKIKENPELAAKYLVREKVIDTIRTFFKSQGFHEVETPILVPVPSTEPNLEVFETEIKTTTGKSRRAFLILSPEYSLKKLISAGLGNIFEVTKVFRNREDVSSAHNPEFSMLEWYRVGADYTNLMADFENLFTEIIKAVNPGVNLLSWVYQGQTYDLSLPWPKISVAEAFQKYCRIDTVTLLDEKLLREEAIKKNYCVDRETSWEQIFYQMFFNEIEPRFKSSHKPVFIYDYPLAQASLSRKKANDPRFAERFEVFLAGLELGNCFSELTDPREQQNRLAADLEDRKRLGKTSYPVDSDFISALEAGMPQTAGIAVGVDRLVMLAANVAAIAETLFFPGGELFDL